jgi:hypothetical protein
MEKRQPGFHPPPGTNMRLPFLFMISVLLLTPSMAQAGNPSATSEMRVMFVGNSLTYVNNLPALLRAVGASQGIAIATETYAAPGGTLAERWRDGHVAEALRSGRIDIVVLQEQGGHLAACMVDMQSQRTAPCAASLRAYRGVSDLAKAHGARTLLFQTWGPDERWQAKLDRSLRTIADRTSATIFDAAGALHALEKADPAVELFPDNTHPSIQASLMLAIALYREVTGTPPVARDLRIAAPLLPVNAAIAPDAPIESQPGLAGDGKITVVPATLLAPLIEALPGKDDAAGRMDD